MSMLLYGASGHAKVVCSCIESEKIEILGLFDDKPDLQVLNKYPVLGKYDAEIFFDVLLIVSIGDNATRKKVVSEIKHAFGRTKHHSVLIDHICTWGEGTVLLHGAIVQRDTHIGKHCIINTGASIDHDCILSDFVHIAPKATLCGSVTVGEGAFIGANATIKQGVKIGAWAVVGAGAVVLKNVNDFEVVVGNPAK